VRRGALALGLLAAACAPVAAPAGLPAGELQRPAVAGEAVPGFARALERLAAARRAAGLPAAVHDPALSRVAALHADYLRLNVPDRRTTTLDPHAEVAGLPGFTAEGATAARTADVAWRGDMAAAVGSWLATLHHRLALVEPRLAAVGFASARGATSPIHVLTFRAGGLPARGAGDAGGWGGPDAPTAFPGDGQRDVPVGFTPSGEHPDPVPGGSLGGAGYPITLQFPDEPSDVVMRLSGPDGLLDGYVSDPAHPATSGPQGRVACLIPAEPLRPATAYRVEVAAGLAGRQQTWRWGFTTEAVRDVDAADRAALLAAEGGLVRVSGTVSAAVAQPFWQLAIAETPGAGAWLQVQPPAQRRFAWPALDALVGRRFVATGTLDVDENQIGLVLRRPGDVTGLD